MKKIWMLTCLMWVSSQLYAQSNTQNDSSAIMNIITDVFEGMRINDSSKISQHMHPRVKMQSVNINGESTKISEIGEASGWLKAVATEKDQIWDERTYNYQIQSTDKLASVWMDYAFYVGEQFSHCGVNSFQLVKMNEKWKIIYIIDTRKQQGCDDLKK